MHPTRHCTNQHEHYGQRWSHQQGWEVRIIKERVRTTVPGLPCQHLPTVMVKELVANAVKALNMFLANNGILDTMSPWMIVTSLGNPNYNKLHLEFGAFMQAFKDETPTNTNDPWMVGAIALNPSGNAQGSYHFMSLLTGAKITRH